MRLEHLFSHACRLHQRSNKSLHWTSGVGCRGGKGGDDAFVLVVFEVGLARRKQRDVAGEASVQQADRRDERPPAVPRCQGVARQALRHAQTHTPYVAPAGATPGRGSARLARGCYGHSVIAARLWHGVHINQGASRGVPCLLVKRAERRVVERACASKGKSGRHWHRGEGSTICCTCGVWGLSGCLDPSPSQAAVPSGGTVTKAFDMLACAQSSAVCGRASTRRSRRRGGGRGRRSSAR